MAIRFHSISFKKILPVLVSAMIVSVIYETKQYGNYRETQQLNSIVQKMLVDLTSLQFQNATVWSPAAKYTLPHEGGTYLRTLIGCEVSNYDKAETRVKGILQNYKPLNGHELNVRFIRCQSAEPDGESTKEILISVITVRSGLHGIGERLSAISINDLLDGNK